jgi:orotidine-5'-phosphate decarboxylase
LIEQIHKKRSFLCVGLDTDLNKLPEHIKKTEDPIFEFNKQIIEVTKDLAVAYKPNVAFYEALGEKGWQSLRKTVEIIPKDCFTIADAKRGDIGNTAIQYAKAFFNTFNFDAITVSPYMGEDAVKPFLQIKNKWVIILGLTSNSGSSDFQLLELNTGEKLFERVLKVSSAWGTDQEMMYVIGANQTRFLKRIREIVPHHFLLIPGVGVQGGDLNEIVKNGINNDVGLLVSVSRSILYASSGDDFAEKARLEALKIQQQMSCLLKNHIHG